MVTSYLAGNARDPIAQERSGRSSVRQHPLTLYTVRLNDVQRTVPLAVMVVHTCSHP